MSVLVISWDRVGERMAGSAIRTVELARALAAGGLDVVLAAPEGSTFAGTVGPRLATFAPGAPLGELIAAADVVVVSGRVELMTAVKKPLVIDLYDPFVLSNLDLYGDRFNRSDGRALLSLRWLTHHLETGDFFLCASATQRSFWLGMLAAAGRINQVNYEDDPELRRLLAIVPFGVPDAPPEPGAPAVKGIVPGIAPGDRVVTWAGGMWNWVDPLTLIRATALLRARRPDVKTLILGTRHPNPEIGEMAIARQARALADELGLLDQGVSFIDWVPYAERHRYLLESDVGVSLHRPGVESEFAFRTRVLDYLWCGVPMVVTAGDELAARVAREDLGRTVAPDDPVAVADAIDALLNAPDAAARRARIAVVRAELSWSRVVEPLRSFCAAPRYAPDRGGDAWFAAPSERSGVPRKEQALIGEEMVSGARAISPALDASFAPRQQLTATYDGLCQIEVLFWVEPPVAGANLLFELFHAEVARPVARVVVPAGQLPHCDWQRFEFTPLSGSRGRQLEFRLSLTPAGDVEPGAATALGGGRVCVWRCAPPDGEEPRGDSVAFIARYLVGGVVERVPSPPEDFLFMHNTTIPLHSGSTDVPSLDGDLALATAAPAVDVEQIRAELGRVAAQAAAAQQRADALAAALDARIRVEAQDAARGEVRAQMSGWWLLVRLMEGVFSSLLGIARLVKRAVTQLLILGLVIASVPLALLVGLGIVACDLLARFRRAAPEAASAATRRPRPDDAVSIVIPTWNGRSLLEMSIPPLIAAICRHGHPDDEIIVVDNGSEDDTLAVLERMAVDAPQLRWISLPTNEGFAGATNRGARDARNPVLIMLNNDMVVEPDFVQALLDVFGSEPDVFGVSCQIDFIDPGKPRWETGKVHAELRRGIVRLFHLDRFDEDLIYPVFFAGGGASAYDRERFLALGGFDDDVFSPVYIEDVDLGYRAWKRGWASLLAPRSKVHHKHRGTTRRLWSEGRIHSFFVKNLAALLWKNVGSWRLLSRHLAGLVLLPVKVFREAGGRSALATLTGLARQLPATLRGRLREARQARVLSDEEILHLSRYRHAYRARFHAAEEKSERAQVLVVAPYSPAPPVHGGAVRMLNLIREMSARCDVTLLSFTDTEAETRAENLVLLRDLCRDVVLLPRDGHGGGGWLEPTKTRGFHSSAMHDLVEYWLDRRRFDVVQVEYTHMAHYLPRPTPDLLRVLVEHDVTFVAQRRARAIAGSVLRRVNLWYDGLRTLRHEVAAVESADLVLTMSDHDRAELARFVDPRPLVTIPNGVSCRDFPLRADAEEETATILFVGFFRHEPNVEAVLWFAREVLPSIRARFPGAVFRVVGAYPPQELVALAADDPGIEVTGMVPETASHYRRATVFVAPILRGSGTRLKILEAMASGCPVASTRIGAEGLGADPSEIALADRAEDLADAVCALLADAARRQAMARAARAFVERTFDWPAIASHLLAAYGIPQTAPCGADDASSDLDGAEPSPGRADSESTGAVPIWAARSADE